MKVNCKKELIEWNGKLYPCTTSITMDIIGGKWKSVILQHLSYGPLRYSELRKTMPSATERTLSLQLKQLEKDGILSRRVLVAKPPQKVEYALTELGKTLVPLLEMIARWGAETAGLQARIVRVEDRK
ncbi:MAG: helix-turn-helix transcriptional regulator [Cytophagales bacterium]|nr:helix-turn-helix transcriptional regulator [Cytophagales bacterium]